MAVALGSSSTLAEATTVDSVYVAPTGITDGDLLINWHFEFSPSAGAPPTPTAPAGFSTVPGPTWPLANANNGTAIRQWAWYKIASSESGNYTVTHSSCVNRGMMLRVTGADTSTPFSPNATSNTGTGTTSTFTGLTTSVNNCFVLALMSDNNDNGANLTAPAQTPPTFTERIDDNHGNYLAAGTMVTAGATGTPTMTNNSGAAQGWFAVLMSIQPSAATVPIIVPDYKQFPKFRLRSS